MILAHTCNFPSGFSSAWWLIVVGEGSFLESPSKSSGVLTSYLHFFGSKDPATIGCSFTMKAFDLGSLYLDLRDWLCQRFALDQLPPCLRIRTGNPWIFYDKLLLSGAKWGKNCVCSSLHYQKCLWDTETGREKAESFELN